MIESLLWMTKENETHIKEVMKKEEGTIDIWINKTTIRRIVISRVDTKRYYSCIIISLIDTTIGEVTLEGELYLTKEGYKHLQSKYI